MCPFPCLSKILTCPLYFFFFSFLKHKERRRFLCLRIKKKQKKMQEDYTRQNYCLNVNDKHENFGERWSYSLFFSLIKFIKKKTILIKEKKQRVGNISYFFHLPCPPCAVMENGQANHFDIFSLITSMFLFAFFFFFFFWLFLSLYFFDGWMVKCWKIVADVWLSNSLLTCFGRCDKNQIGFESLFSQNGVVTPLCQSSWNW